MQSTPDNITIFLLVTTFLIMALGVFTLSILFVHRKKQIAYQKNLKEVEANYEKNLLKTQLEIQEQTFENISREIHDNISLSLTLAKLHLHTLDWNEKEAAVEKVETTINLLSSSIAQLSNISKGLNADIIIQHGLLKAIEDEIQLIQKTKLFSVELAISGTPFYMDAQRELIIFRIIQEGFNNIIKHARATSTKLLLHYDPEKLKIFIRDNGTGFDETMAGKIRQAGLKNMETRIRVLKGTMKITSSPGNGTILLFTIPVE